MHRQFIPAFLGAVLFAGGFFSGLSAATLEATPANYLSVIPTLKPGDTLQLRGGVYTTWLNSNIPAGTSWSAPVKITRYPGETPILQASSGPFCVYLQGGSKQYIILDGLVIDATGTQYGAVKFDRPAVGQPAAHHIRVINCEVKNSHESAFVVSYSSDYNEFLNLNVHDNGKSLDGGGLYGYEWYIRGSYNLIEGCDIHHQGSSGAQVYSNEAATEPPRGNTFRNCRVHDNCVRSGPEQQRGAGLSFFSGSGHRMEGCDIRNNYIGASVSYATGCVIQNSTICGNQTNVVNTGNAQMVNNQVGACGATTTPPPVTNVEVSQTQTPVVQSPPSTSQPSGPSTSGVAVPFLIAGVIGAALLLGD